MRSTLDGETGRAKPRADRPRPSGVHQHFLGLRGPERVARRQMWGNIDLLERCNSSVVRVTLRSVEVTESLLRQVPVDNLRVPRAEFGALWIEAERLNRAQTGNPDPDWYPAGVAVTCRWLAAAVVQDQTGRSEMAIAPATRRRGRAYEELIEAEYLAAEQLDIRRSDLVKHRPGWCEEASAQRCGGPGGTTAQRRYR